MNYDSRGTKCEVISKDKTTIIRLTDKETGITICQECISYERM